MNSEMSGMSGLSRKRWDTPTPIPRHFKSSSVAKPPAQIEHDMYLKMLQEQNRVARKMKKKDAVEVEREEREKGFSLWNGANNAVASGRAAGAKRKGAGSRRRGRVTPKASAAVASPVSPPRGKWASKMAPITIITDDGEGVNVNAPAALTGDYEEDFDSCSDSDADASADSDGDSYEDDFEAPTPDLSLSYTLSPGDVKCLRQHLKTSSNGSPTAGTAPAVLSQVVAAAWALSPTCGESGDGDDIEESIDNDTINDTPPAAAATAAAAEDLEPRSAVLLEFPPPKAPCTTPLRSSPATGLHFMHSPNYSPSLSRSGRRRPASGPATPGRSQLNRVVRSPRPASGPVMGRSRRLEAPPTMMVMQHPRVNGLWPPAANKHRPTVGGSVPTREVKRTPHRVTALNGTPSLPKLGNARPAELGESNDEDLSAMLRRAQSLEPNQKRKLMLALANLE